MLGAPGLGDLLGALPGLMLPKVSVFRLVEIQLECNFLEYFKPIAVEGLLKNKAFYLHCGFFRHLPEEFQGFQQFKT